MEDPRTPRNLDSIGEAQDRAPEHSHFALHVLLRQSDGREESREFLKVVKVATRAEALVLFIVDEEIAEIYPVAREGDDAHRIIDCMAGRKANLLNMAAPSAAWVLSEEVSQSVHRFGDTTFVLFSSQQRHLGALGLLNQQVIPEKEWTPLFLSAVQLLLGIATSRNNRKLVLRDHELRRITEVR